MKRQLYESGGIMSLSKEGIGDNSFSFLEELDDIEGRTLDNANFFAVPDPKKMSPEDMFDKMMEEYPQWVKDIKAKGWLAK